MEKLLRHFEGKKGVAAELHEIIKNGSFETRERLDQHLTLQWEKEIASSALGSDRRADNYEKMRALLLRAPK